MVENSRRGPTCCAYNNIEIQYNMSRKKGRGAVWKSCGKLRGKAVDKYGYYQRRIFVLRKTVETVDNFSSFPQVFPQSYPPIG